MSTDLPIAPPPFDDIAKHVLEEAETGQASRGVLGKPIDAVLADNLKKCWEMGVGSEQARRLYQQPPASLFFRGMPLTGAGEVERTWVVMAGETPTSDGLPPWIPFQMSYGDRALMRALAAEMISRLDAVEELEHEAQERERQSQRPE